MIRKEPVEEAARTLEAAERAEIPMRLTGGVGVAMISPSARRHPLAREYADIDYVAPSRAKSKVERLFVELGYKPEQEFNNLHGGRRLFFLDSENRREADVFIDAIRGCHNLMLADRLELSSHVITPTDLMLSKLQVVETNEKDFLDLIALLADHPVATEDRDGVISLERVRAVCSTDWGWWRTVTKVAQETLEVAGRFVTAGGVPAEAVERLKVVIEDLETSPKSRKWKLRARVGDRVRWHEEPEGLSHSHS